MSQFYQSYVKFSPRGLLNSRRSVYQLNRAFKLGQKYHVHAADEITIDKQFDGHPKTSEVNHFVVDADVVVLGLDAAGRTAISQVEGPSLRAKELIEQQGGWTNPALADAFSEVLHVSEALGDLTSKMGLDNPVAQDQH